MSKLLDDIKDGKGIPPIPPKNVQDEFTKASASGYKLHPDAQIKDFSAEDFRTGYERGYRAGWRDAVEKAAKTIRAKKTFSSLTEWGEGFEDALSEAEERVLALKDGDTE